MTNTYLTVAEKTDERIFRSNYILHDGWKFYISETDDKKQMDALLNFLECEIEIDRVSENETNGKIVFYNVSKNIISKRCGGFWNLEQVTEEANGRRIKSFIGLSNGSLTTCYAIFDDIENTVEILRPNPNAKDVYQTMPTNAHIEYKKNHWVM